LRANEDPKKLRCSYVDIEISGELTVEAQDLRIKWAGRWQARVESILHLVVYDQGSLNADLGAT